MWRIQRRGLLPQIQQQRTPSTNRHHPGQTIPVERKHKRAPTGKLRLRNDKQRALWGKWRFQTTEWSTRAVNPFPWRTNYWDVQTTAIRKIARVLSNGMRFNYPRFELSFEYKEVWNFLLLDDLFIEYWLLLYPLLLLYLVRFDWALLVLALLVWALLCFLYLPILNFYSFYLINFYFDFP